MPQPRKNRKEDNTTKRGLPVCKGSEFYILPASKPKERGLAMYKKNPNAKTRGKQLLTDESTLDLFRKKFIFIRAVREFLHNCGVLEVEAPYLNIYREGAPLLQYETDDPVTGERFFLRHSPENFLRRIVQPFRQVYEMGKNFRIEKESDFRANEYILLEHWSAEHSYLDGVDMLKALLLYAVSTTFGSLNTGFVDFNKLSVVPFDEVMTKHLGFSMYDPDCAKKALVALKHYELPVSKEKYEWEIFELVLKHFVEANIKDPTIVIDFPVPLQHISVVDYEKQISQRLTLVIDGVEVSDGGIRFDNASDYRAVFDENADFARRYMELSDFAVSPEFYEDIDFVHEKVFVYGVGIDRLFALCVGKNIHDVILFPHR